MKQVFRRSFNNQSVLESLIREFLGQEAIEAVLQNPIISLNDPLVCIQTPEAPNSVLFAHIRSDPNTLVRIHLDGYLVASGVCKQVSDSGSTINDCSFGLLVKNWQSGECSVLQIALIDPLVPSSFTMKDKWKVHRQKVSNLA